MWFHDSACYKKYSGLCNKYRMLKWIAQNHSGKTFSVSIWTSSLFVFFSRLLHFCISLHGLIKQVNVWYHLNGLCIKGYDSRTAQNKSKHIRGFSKKFCPSSFNTTLLRYVKYSKLCLKRVLVYESRFWTTHQHMQTVLLLFSSPTLWLGKKSSCHRRLCD